MNYFVLPGTNSIILIAIFIYFIYVCYKNRPRNIATYPIPIVEQKAVQFMKEHNTEKYKKPTVTVYYQKNEVIKIKNAIQILTTDNDNSEINLIFPYNINPNHIYKIIIAYQHTDNVETDHLEITNRQSSILVKNK
jgi:hypothetical protein